MNKSHVWLLALRGVLAIVFGALAIIWPGVTILALSLLFGAYAVVDGVTGLALAFRRSEETQARVLQGVLGGISVLAGVLALIWPHITALVLVLLVGAWAMVTGALGIWAAARLRGPLLLLAGVAAVGMGILMLARPGVGAIVIATLVGVYAIVTGLLLLAETWQLHRSSGSHPHGHRAAPAGG